MLRKVTKTYDETTITAVIVNLETLDCIEKSFKIENYSKTKKDETQVTALLSEDFALSEITGKEVIKGTYWMTESEFIKNAEQVKERPQGNYIARSIEFTKVTCIEVNKDKEGNRTAKVREYMLEGEKTEQEALRALKKSKETENKKIVKVTGVKKIERVYAMTDEKFRKLGYNQEKAGD